MAGAIADASFGEIRRQPEYKTSEVRYVDRFAPISKTCSACGAIHDMPLSVRVMDCDCGNHIGRDVNAAIDILR